MIKAIETKYKGYQFRSRLEARWAVFFDSLGVKWEYEPEGFDLENGIYYLPDFKVEIYSDVAIAKNLYAWIEIKGSNPTVEELEKCRILYTQSHIPTYLFSGTPGEHEIYRMNPIESKKQIGCLGEITANVFALEPFWYMKIKPWHVANAIEDARSARFEFGENQ